MEIGLFLHAGERVEDYLGCDRLVVSANLWSTWEEYEEFVKAHPGKLELWCEWNEEQGLSEMIELANMAREVKIGKTFLIPDASFDRRQMEKWLKKLKDWPVFLLGTEERLKESRIQKALFSDLATGRVLHSDWLRTRRDDTWLPVFTDFVGGVFIRAEVENLLAQCKTFGLAQVYFWSAGAARRGNYLDLLTHAKEEERKESSPAKYIVRQKVAIRRVASLGSDTLGWLEIGESPDVMQMLRIGAVDYAKLSDGTFVVAQYKGTRYVELI